MALDTIPKQEGGKLKAVASGTLPSGQPVVVNADGTVSVVGNTTVTGSAGTPAVFETGGINRPDVAFSSAASKLLFAYRDKSNSNYGTAVVGTVSGTSITFGTPVVFQNTNAQYPRLTYDSGNDKFVIVYRNVGGSYYGTAIVATISGTSVSFGSSVVFNSAVTSEFDVEYDANAGKVLIGYSDSGPAGNAIVGTVSGTSISFGSEATFNSSSTSEVNMSYDSDAQKTVISYRGTVDYGHCVVATISGTSVSFGSEVTFSASDSTHNIWSTYDSNAQKTVITFRDVGDSNKAKAIVGAISGTSISFGTAVVFNDSAQANFQMCAYDPYAKNVAIAYGDIGNSGYGTFINGTVSGTTISFSSEVVFEQPGYTQYISMAADTTNNKMVVSYQDYTNSERGTACVLTSAGSIPNLTAENYIGMSGGVVVQAGSTGTAATFESAAIQNTAATFDSNSNKVVLTYQDGGNSFYGTAVVGSVSGSSITFGTPVVFESASNGVAAITFDSNSNKVVLAYYDGSNSNYGTSRVGTVSGTSISFGNAAVYESAVSYYNAIGFDSNSNKVVVAYRDQGNSNYGTAVVGTVSGTSISFGTPVVFNAGSVEDCWVVFDTTNNKIVILYKDTANSNYGTAVVGTVSGTSISFGSEVAFNSAATTYPIGVFDPSSGKVVIAFRDEGDSNNGKVMVGTVSGTSISFGSEVLYASGITANGSGIALDSTTNQVILVYQDDTNGIVKTGTVSGTTISLSSATAYNAVNSTYNRVAYDSNNNVSVIAFKDGTNSNYGKALVFSQDIRGQVADGDNATVDIVGTVSSNQSGLTAGQKYYVQTDGTIGTTPADPSVLAGTAVSATKMVVKS